MILGIQQHRILTLLSSAFFDCLWSGSQKVEKYDTSVRKSYFLCLWGAEVSAASLTVHRTELFLWSACEPQGAVQDRRDG